MTVTRACRAHIDKEKWIKTRERERRGGSEGGAKIMEIKGEQIERESQIKNIKVIERTRKA